MDLRPEQFRSNLDRSTTFMKRMIIAAGAAVAVGAASLGMTAGVATASTTASTSTSGWGNSYLSRTTAIHNAPSRQAPAITTLSAGSSVQALCFIDNGEQVEGNEFWFRVAIDSRTGWVPKAVLGGVPTGTPGC
jgi:Bacterial SH3 domain